MASFGGCGFASFTFAGTCGEGESPAPIVCRGFISDSATFGGGVMDSAGVGGMIQDNSSGDVLSMEGINERNALSVR